MTKKIFYIDQQGENFFQTKRKVFFSERNDEDVYKEHMELLGESVSEESEEPVGDPEGRVDEISESAQDQIRSLIDGWTTNRFAKTKLMGKRALKAKIEEIAKKRLEEEVSYIKPLENNEEGEFGQELNVEKHTKLSLAILTSQITIYTDIKQPIEAALKEEKAKLSRVNAVLENINSKRYLRSINISRTSLNRQIRRRIKNYQMAKDAVAELTDKAKEDKKKKEKKEYDKYQKYEENIRSIIAAKNPDVLPDFQEVLMKSALKKDETILNDFLRDHQGVLELSPAEEKVIKNAVKTLIINNKISYDFHINAQLERGRLNKSGDNVEDRVKRIEQQQPINRRLKVDDLEGGDWILVTKVDSAKKRLFVRMKGASAVIDVSNKKKPLMTVKRGDSYDFYGLQMPNQSDERQMSVTSIEFKAEKIDLNSSTTTPPPPPKPPTPPPPPTPTPRPPAPPAAPTTS